MTQLELPGSRLDDWWTRVQSTEAARRAWRWGGPAVVTAVAAATRLIGLGHPGSLVFDETYYVKDAYTLSQLGYEGSWPADANTAFNAGDPSGYLSGASFVAHPPVGKWIIAAGMALFGADDPFGWRVSVAIVGILLVVLTMGVAHLLFARPLLTVIAGGLLAIDGNAIVLSRVALLDTMLAFFALLGVLFVVLDRGFAKRRLAAHVAARGTTGWGPALFWRPWLLAASIAFGLATGVKWSGLYFLAIFGVYVVVGELLLRRQAGIEFWATGGILKQAPVTFLLLVPLAAAVYLVSWTGWFVTDGGYHRHWVEGGGEAWTGGLAWVPTAFQNWWHYEAAVYTYHVGESSPHGYQSNPLTWLFLVRPTSMFYQGFSDGSVQTILDIANPLIWWAATAAAFWLVVRVVQRLRRREPVATEALILTGIAAGYLPWLLYLHRTVFSFYTIAFEPYLILALTAALGMLLGTAADPESRRTVGIRAVGVFLGVCVLLSLFFLPIWTGMSVPDWFFRIHLWLPSWL
ncbi:dolichyl-phosphate-mannose--protein mannosyltransferase [Pseudolysinimonas yzui]|uniref:Polyprenol-phosphate-mannose--protein mannosyltransferase n=1 Tax=Pseudolysinimonas yzui TaxID=2708254 RepID=A0A8J3GR75_9MICO|nr:phospholipid carrier-dependent glycosyltransferase [Pseudolysinimonas yzui]GHF19342.1 dolichyl-phosphate-mannose--protein mannosyltransferase [Pseudolysinimonas yzui]